MSYDFRLGADYLGDRRCRFCVWASTADTLNLHILTPRERTIPLEKIDRGYHQADLHGIEPESTYLFQINGAKERPDPASRFQPQGVHGPSQVVDSCFSWDDGSWFGIPLHAYIIYEIHVGTFTREGTFDAMLPYLEDLKALGITALEIMPVAQFPGERNWGYDGAYPFAVQNSYGGPRGLKRLVNACHQRGLAVILDVAYNHLGPEGNYLGEFAPYFTDRYKTPWGSAVNFDGAGSMEVRRYFLENALYWITDVHLDALRLDAIDAIYDSSARTFLEELALAVHRRAESLNRRVHLIAESDQNDMRVLRPRELGGYGLDAQWNDDFHHALHTLLTAERNGYYQDFGTFHHLVKAFRDGFVYSGEYSQYRRRPHGNSSRGVAGSRLVVFAQNHDQVGNRMLGERFSRLVSFEELKLAAGAVLLAPCVPLLFMGEEYGETAPFLYFISHLDAGLVEAVRKGRREEFASFRWQGEPPDPQSDSTFQSSKLNRDKAREGSSLILHDFYKELISLRKSLPDASLFGNEQTEVLAFEEEEVLSIRRWQGGEENMTVFNFGKMAAAVTFPLPPGRWKKLLDSADERWGGSGSSIPVELVSTGKSSVTMSARSLAVFSKCAAELQNADCEL